MSSTDSVTTSVEVAVDPVTAFGVTDPDGYEWGFMQPTGKGYEQSEGGLTEVRA